MLTKKARKGADRAFIRNRAGEKEIFGGTFFYRRNVNVVGTSGLVWTTERMV